MQIRNLPKKSDLQINKYLHTNCSAKKIQMIVQNADITCIFQGLSGKGDIFLSNQTTAHNTALIQSLKISAILSISEFQLQGTTRKLLDYYSRIKFERGKSLNIADHLSSVYQFIDDSRKKTNVLLHCQTGNIESAVFAIAYLIKKYPQNLNKVLNLVKRRRNQITITKQYIMQLNKFAVFLNPKDPGIQQGNHCQVYSTRASFQNDKNRSYLTRNNNKRVPSLVYNTPIFQLKKESCESPQKYIENKSGLMKLQDQIKQFSQQLKVNDQEKQNNQQKMFVCSLKNKDERLEDQAKEASTTMSAQVIPFNDENKNTSNLPLAHEFETKISIQLQQDRDKQEQIDDLAIRFQKFLRRQTKYKTLFEPSKKQGNREFSPQFTKASSLKVIQSDIKHQDGQRYAEQNISLLLQSSFNSNSIQFFSKQLVTEKQINQNQRLFPRARSQSSNMKSSLKKSTMKMPSQSKKTVKFSTQNIIHDFSQLDVKRTSIVQIIEKKHEQKQTFLQFKPANVSFGGKVLR